LKIHAAMCPGAPDDAEVRGAEVELSMLFADVRGSSKLARSTSTLEFTQLMDRFYRSSMDVLVQHDAIVEKFVGDEVVGLFLPFLAGPHHAERAVEAARALITSVGYGSPAGPWLPLGVAVHTGPAFVGIVGSQDARDFTALGDPMNIAAHLAAKAAAGEILVTRSVIDHVPSLATTNLDHHEESLKGYPVDAYVLRPPATAAAG
jgi:adenylate cyclase